MESRAVNLVDLFIDLHNRISALETVVVNLISKVTVLELVKEVDNAEADKSQFE
jgi:hypothetical protein